MLLILLLSSDHIWPLVSHPDTVILLRGAESKPNVTTIVRCMPSPLFISKRGNRAFEINSLSVMKWNIIVKKMYFPIIIGPHVCCHCHNGPSVFSRRISIKDAPLSSAIVEHLLVMVIIAGHNRTWTNSRKPSTFTLLKGLTSFQHNATFICLCLFNSDRNCQCLFCKICHHSQWPVGELL